MLPESPYYTQPPYVPTTQVVYQFCECLLVCVCVCGLHDTRLARLGDSQYESAMDFGWGVLFFLLLDFFENIRSMPASCMIYVTKYCSPKANK